MYYLSSRDSLSELHKSFINTISKKKKKNLSEKMKDDCITLTGVAAPNINIYKK